MTEENRALLKHWWAKSKVADVIVFDLDGTLIDSDFANFLSYEAAVMQVMSSQGRLTLNPSVRITRETIRESFPTICDKKLARIFSEKERLYPRYLSKTTINAQVVEILKRSIGKEIILATNSHRARADLLLEHHELADKFTQKIYRDTTDPRDKYIRLMSGVLDRNRSILIFENDLLAIKSAITCGIQSDCVINVVGA